MALYWLIPNKLLDLPREFRLPDYFSVKVKRMADGFSVPDNADGMGCFASG